MLDAGLEFAHPHCFWLLPLPLLVFRLIPAYRTRQSAIKVPFFDLLIDLLDEPPREGERVACAGLLLGRGADPDIVGELACDVLQHLEAGGVDAVVIGKEDSHQVSGSSFVNPPI